MTKVHILSDAHMCIYYLLAMASNLLAMVSNLEAMSSNLRATTCKSKCSHVVSQSIGKKLFLESFLVL